MKSYPFSSPRRSLLLALPLAAMVTPSVHAQDKNPDHVVLGAGIALTPEYQGSDDYRLIPIPVIDIKEGRLFANLRNGIGVEAIGSEHVTVGASLVFIPGYRRRDVPAGVDRLSSGVGGRIFANLRAGGAVATVGVVKGISGGTEGIVADASLSYPLALSTRLTVTPTLGATWADRKHNDGYFGITAAEALASGLPAFTAGSGFKDVSAALTTSYRLSDRLTLSATGSVTSLLGAVKDSPLVMKQTQPFGILTLSYRM
ncbi:outer membrane protein [Sphingopyxis sp. YR583]|uniref:MipA/OmpV family protein n=1 Tax=Sphingopyxis sp. YR583 TaxID=1881047 RepID=UPI0008A7ECFE|nr:MipA/OmpV family protein [Sphingopyxis sp. YR583]SEH19130.1 outer membrane protein [Sphingopyxis sp. YR583]